MTADEVKKGILIIADGLGGRPTDVSGRTCLEAAQTPNLDALARRGAIGLLDPIAPGVRPGSDTAHLSILGYDPYTVYTGRGVFECLGAGMDVRPGDVCFRANFATAEPDGECFLVTDRRAGRIDAGQAELAAALNEIRLKRVPGVEFEFRPTTQHRGALVLRGESLSRYVTDNDPHENGKKASPFEARAGRGDNAACRTANALSELARRSYDVLHDHPVNRHRLREKQHAANYLLIRGGADCPHLDPVTLIYGVGGAVIAGGALYRGVALACGMTAIDVAGATGGLDTDLLAKANAVLGALDSPELGFVFLHVKGTDNAGHDKDAKAKVSFIERIDRELIATLMDGLDWAKTHLAFTGDHTTPICFGDHTPEPVPILFAGPNVHCDDVESFGEGSAARGGLGRFSGRVLPMVLGYCDRSPKYGS